MVAPDAVDRLHLMAFARNQFPRRESWQEPRYNLSQHRFQEQQRAA